ncbi:MAG TPA: N-acetylmuramic acid 6-phosphate etherase [Jatrophihabitans sp.]|nr:N-acetylmuramic acid 6-phosphate etherase [Jatrophihabitans sp.]
MKMAASAGGADAGAWLELDLLDTSAAVEAVLAGQARVADAVAVAQQSIAAAVELIVDRYDAGGRILLLGAGTSGRLAVQEAVEVPGTYGIDPDRIQGRVAGGGPGQLVGSDAAEDDAARGRADLDELAAGPADVLIAVAASGRTPYTVAAATRARELGAAVVTVTNQPGSELAGLAEVAIEVPVGVEVVAGSTRLAAGTAQKLVLNTLTTAAMIRLGHVHRNYMVDVVPANDKLRHRVSGVVAASTGATEDEAWTALQRCDWNARAAIVHLATGLDARQAARHAAAHRTVREAIEAARG